MKRISLIALMMALVMTFTGCAGAEGGNLKDKLEKVSNEKPQKGGDEDIADKEKAKNEETESQSGPERVSLPKFYISTERVNEYPYEDTYLLKHTYDQIHLDSDDSSYGILATNLEQINEDIGINESTIKDEETKAIEKLSDSDIKKKLNMERCLIKEDWNLYVRRADSDVFSVACQYRSYSEEGDTVVMTAHSYSMDSGEELEFSDIVNDEDAFLKILARELKATYMREMALYGNEMDEDSFDGEKELDSILEEGNYSWVLDPQGVTFWFENVNALIGHMSVGVLFSDDTDKNIFNPRYSENVPDEWIMQIPGYYSDTRFDCDDDGYTDTISWLIEKNDAPGFTFESGINFFYNDRFYPAVDICPPNGNEWLNVRGMLVHRDSATTFVLEHYEDLYPFINTFALDKDNIERADSISAGFATVDPDKGYGVYAASDPSRIDVFVIPDESMSHEIENGTLSIEGDGKTTLSDKKSSGKIKKKPSKGKSEPGKKDSGKKKSGKGSGLSKSDAAEIADNLGGQVGAVEVHDYDGDGADEAFVVLLGEDDGFGGNLAGEVWFISSEGDTLMMRDNFNDLSLYTENDGFYMDYADENVGFFYGDCGAYGSGWLTFIFGVKDGKPYELNISMKTEGFYEEAPGKFYTLTDDFTDGHDYLITPLKYDSRTGEFSKDKPTDRSWLNADQ